MRNIVAIIVFVLAAAGCRSNRQVARVESISSSHVSVDSVNEHSLVRSVIESSRATSINIDSLMVTVKRPDGTDAMIIAQRVSLGRQNSGRVAVADSVTFTRLTLRADTLATRREQSSHREVTTPGSALWSVPVVLIVILVLFSRVTKE